MKKLDMGSSIFWLIISTFISIHSLDLGLGTFHNPGPGFLFFWGGIILGILSIIVLIMALIHPRSGLIESQEKEFANVNWVKIISILFALIIYGVILEKLGFLVSTFLFISFLLSSIEAKKWYLVIFVALTSSFLTHALFELWLKTRLPRGIFEI